MQFKFFSRAERADFINVPIAQYGFGQMGFGNFFSRRHGEIVPAREHQFSTGPIGGNGNNVGGCFQPKFIAAKCAVHYPQISIVRFGRDRLAGLAAQNGDALPVRLGGGREQNVGKKIIQRHQLVWPDELEAEQ